MAAQQDAGRGQLYINQVRHRDEHGRAIVDAQRAARQQEVKGACASSASASVPPPLAPPTHRPPHRSGRPGRRLASLQDAADADAAAGPSREAPLPTPPLSPAVTRAAELPATQVAKPSELADPHRWRANCEEQIRRLERELADTNRELNDTRREVAVLRAERAGVTGSQIHAAGAGGASGIAHARRGWDELVRMIHDREGMIETLESRLEAGRTREARLRAELREAERRVAEGDRLREEQTRGQAPARAEERQSRRGSSSHQGNFSVTGDNWEFRRRKGEKATPLKVLLRAALGL